MYHDNLQAAHEAIDAKEQEARLRLIEHAYEIQIRDDEIDRLTLALAIRKPPSLLKKVCTDIKSTATLLGWFGELAMDVTVDGFLWVRKVIHGYKHKYTNIQELFDSAARQGEAMRAAHDKLQSRLDSVFRRVEQLQENVTTDSVKQDFAAIDAPANRAKPHDGKCSVCGGINGFDCFHENHHEFERMQSEPHPVCEHCAGFAWEDRVNASTGVCSRCGFSLNKATSVRRTVTASGEAGPWEAVPRKAGQGFQK